MSTSFSRLLRLPKRGTYAALLLALVLLDLVYPVLAEAGLRRVWLAEVFFLLLLFSSLAAAVDQRRTLVLLIVIGLASELFRLGLGDALVGAEAALAIHRGGRLVFTVITFGIILRHVLASGTVTADLILGALCAYLLLGLAFGMAYEWVEASASGSFTIPPGRGGGPLGPGLVAESLQYFSLTTLTTLGYGDVTPLSPLARSLATLEAFLGQVFLAVVIARLVAVHVMQGKTGADR
ncbi:MAG: potassium channel family protein [Planctomycetota bacterium]